MQIRQISVYLERRPGSLQKLTFLLGEQNIRCLAVMLADTERGGVARMVIHSADFARMIALLQERGYEFNISPVLCLRVHLRPFALSEALARIEKDSIFTQYMYPFYQNPEGETLLVLCPSDAARCVVSLAGASDVELLSQEALDALA